MQICLSVCPHPIYTPRRDSRQIFNFWSLAVEPPTAPSTDSPHAGVRPEPNPTSCGAVCVDFLHLTGRIWIASICMPYLSYPVRRHVIPLSTLLTLVCSISVSWFCDHRACISQGGRIGTDTGCAGCRRVERTV